MLGINIMIVALASALPGMGFARASHYHEGRQESFSNPVIYSDFPDNDVFRGPDDAYYFSASNMHYSPGAPILRSADLINWEVIGHSIPSLTMSPQYNLTDGNAYIQGSWASSMRHRPSNGLWYWVGCIDGRSYVYTAPEATGPWGQASTIETCYYDCGLFIDEDDKMYVVYGINNIQIAELDAAGLAEVSNQIIFSVPEDDNHVEGNRLYKRGSTYYVLNDDPTRQSTSIWKSDSLFGEWTSKTLGESIQSPIPGGNIPHQGSLVQTPDDRWFFMSFSWSYPAGRLPVLAPIEWDADGFPTLATVDGGWGQSYPYPLPRADTPSWTGVDTFQGTQLALVWEWNHNPDETKYSVNNGLTLQTATVTESLYEARNTLTQRGFGPNPNATVAIDFSNMADGDRAGLSALRDRSASIGIERSGSDFSIVMRDGITLNSDWETESPGTVIATAPIEQTNVRLQGSMDLRPDGTTEGSFSFSTDDGSTFTPLGPSFELNKDWAFFPGYRWGIFNFATQAIGGSVSVTEFEQM